jgi:hypothetical protein
MSIKRFIHDYVQNHVDDFNDQLFLRSDEAIIDQLEKIIISIQTHGLFTIRVKGFTVVDNYDDIQIILRKHYERVLKGSKKAADDNRFNYIDLQESKIKLLIVHYETSYKNERENLDVIIEVPRVVNKFYFFLKGNYYSPMYQIVDASTYNNSSSKKNSKKATITLKTNFQPIRITRFEVPVGDTDGNKYSFTSFSCFAFNKSVPAIVYLFAKYGVVKALQNLGLANYLFISPDNQSNKDICSFCSSKNDKIFINVDRYFMNNPIMQHAVVTLLNMITSSMNFNDLYNTDIWIERLGGGFVTQNKLQKGLTILKSFESTLDINIQEQIYLPWKYKKDMFVLLQWLLCEFNNLKMKDTMNITTKKVRCAEYIAAIYAKKLTTNIHRLSNKGKKINLKEIERTINIKPDWLIVEITKSQLVGFRNIVNDMDAFLATKFTYKGISGVGDTNGSNGSRSIPNQFRLLDISNMGILDPDASSPSDPGVNGSIIPFLKLNTNGYLSDNKEPITYEQELKELCDEYKKIKGLREVIEFKHNVLDDNNVTTEDVDIANQTELVANHVTEALGGIMETNDQIIKKHLDSLTGLPIAKGSDILKYDE